MRKRGTNPVAAVLGLGLLGMATAAAAPMCAAVYCVVKPLELLARLLPERPERPEVWQYLRVGNRVYCRRIPVDLVPGEAGHLTQKLLDQQA